MTKKKHIGSSFESFLKEEGILEEVNAAAIKAVIAHNLQEYMERKHLTQMDMAELLDTSRTGLRRLLDPKNTSVTLLTLNKAASVLGKRIEINLVSNKTNK